jgi:programmed cell death 6-interacting protein
VVRNNLKYELMNILYNLAALYSQLAIGSPRGTTEGLKTAANYFSQAAGVLSHMQKDVLPELRMSDPPEDMDANTLESLTQLLLAESQECFWQKAVMDGYKDASIAKLAARVSDLYNLAGEAAMKSEAVSSAWIHHMSAKHHHFAAAAQYRAACDCLEKRRYGEEIARLKDAVACVQEGLKETRGGYLSGLVIADLNNLKGKLEEDLKRAERDNDVIYLSMSTRQRLFSSVALGEWLTDREQMPSRPSRSSKSWTGRTWLLRGFLHRSQIHTTFSAIRPNLARRCSLS